MPRFRRATTNRDLFDGADGTYWADLSEVNACERTLLEQELQPSRSTVEAGTGGGRLLRELERRGFDSLTGFDFVSSLIERARSSHHASQIRFDVENATALSYQDGTFSQVLYLQQLLSLIDTAAGRQAAIHEAYRILAPGGTALFSFLSYEARVAQPVRRIYVSYVKTLRSLRGAKRSEQEMPWLRVGHRFNLGSLVDLGPYVYWYRIGEIEALLVDVGFEVRRIASRKAFQANEKTGVAAAFASTLEELTGDCVYVVCRKPAAS